MSKFGNTLFGGSSFIRWTLSPFVLLFAVLMPLAVEQWTAAGIALMAGMEFMCIALLAGFWLPAHLGRLAFRGLAASVFLAYSAYVGHEYFVSETPFSAVGSRADTSPRNALLGLVMIGLPSLWYALLGRFTLRAPSPEPESEPERA